MSEEWRKANLRYWPFVGRGFIQLTLATNYVKYGDLLGVNLIDDLDLALDPEIAARIFAAYWRERDIQEAADREDWADVRARVQGADAGLDRLTLIVERLLA